jgi:hypothetical protein
MYQDKGSIGRLTREYEQILERLQKCEIAVNELANLSKEWVPGSPPSLDDKFQELINSLSAIEADLEEHSRFEEKEIMPFLSRHAGEIIERGLIQEHKQILESIRYLKKAAQATFVKPADRGERIIQEIDVREAISSILKRVQSHCEAQSVIYRLARQVLAEEQQNLD